MLMAKFNVIIEKNRQNFDARCYPKNWDQKASHSGVIPGCFRWFNQPILFQTMVANRWIFRGIISLGIEKNDGMGLPR